MHHKAIKHPCPGCELTEGAREDAQTQLAVLGAVISQLPCLLTIPELVREVEPDGSDAIERAVGDLAGAGLLRCEGASVLPTRAAMLATRLAALS